MGLGKGEGRREADLRRGVDETGADDELDQVLVVKGTHLADDEAGGEEDGAGDVEAGESPALVVANRVSAMIQDVELPMAGNIHALVNVKGPRDGESHGEEHRGALVGSVEEDASWD